MKTTEYFRHLFLVTVEFIFQWKYQFLVVFLISRYLLFITNGLWTGDFWEHSAVVRELMAHPLNPLHPQLLLDSEHSFFTPYALIVASTGWLFHFDSITSLAIWGIINLCLLSYGLRLFISTINLNQSSSIAFYALVLILLLWGSNEWSFSGFYSFEGLNSVLPYPSTFALGLSFLGLTVHATQLNNYSATKQILLIFICTIVLITHSLTAIFLILGIVCQSLTYSKLNIIILLRDALTIVFFFCFALIWPYFSMFRLMTGEANVYHFANSSMYLNIIDRIWPTIFLAPIIFMQAIRKKNWSLGLTLLSLVVVYAYGYLSNKYSYGRSIAFILLLSNILIAQTIMDFENYLRKKYILLVSFKISTVLVLLLCIGIWINQSASRMLTIGNSIYLGRTISDQISYKDLLFISAFTTKDDHILADVEASWIIPTLGGKVVATDHPLAFVPDWYIRKWQVMEFFNPDTSTKRRIEIFKKYQPNFLVITKSSNLNWKSILSQFTNEINGLLVFENQKYILLKFD